VRESIGGAFLIKIMVVFIVLYNSLLAIAVNYAMVFRVKNRIIDLLEQYEGCAGVITGCNGNNCVADYVSTVGYYRAAAPTGGSGRAYTIEAFRDGNRGTHYRVTTYITFDFPWINQFLNVSIQGETKTIYGKFETNSTCRNV